MSEFGKWRRLSSRIFICTSLGGLIVFGCGKKEGAEGEDCYANGTCDGSLVCLSNTCVDPNAAGTSGGDGDSGGLDSGACFSCGDEACPSERSACNDTKGCPDLLDCTLGCGSDVSCAGSCSVAGLTAQEAGNAGLAASSYVACAVPACASECTPGTSTTGTSATGDGDSGFDLDACTSCGESACSSEYQACSNTGSCQTLFDCTWGCAGSTDANCAADCLGQVSTDDLYDVSAALTDLMYCQAVSCLDECAYDIDTTTGDTDTGDTDTGDTDTGDTDTGDTGDTGGNDLDPGQLFDGTGVNVDVPELGAKGSFFILEDSVEDGALVSDGLSHSDFDAPDGSGEPSTFEGSAAPCVSGVLAMVTSPTGASCETTSSSCDWEAIWGGGIGLTLNETDGVASAFDASAYDGFSFNLAGSAGGAPIRFMIEDMSGNQFCTEISSGSNAVDFGYLLNNCWDPTTLSLNPANIKQISWQFVPDASYSYSVSNFCVTDLRLL